MNFLLRRFSTSTLKKHVQVCILGADTHTGQFLALLLKQNPLVSVLHLQGTSRVETMAIDLSHFDTQCNVKTYFDFKSVPASIKSADIVVMLGLNTCSTPMTLAKLVMAEAPRISKLSQMCAKYAPKAILIVSVKPVSVTLPIVAEVFRKTHWYHPARLLGSLDLAQIKANSLAGHFQNLDPQMVHVPIIGGPDLDCAIPLFMQTRPVGLTKKDAEKLTEKFKKEEPQHACASLACGLNRMVSGVALGLCGDENANVVAFVRSNLISTCQHLVSTVKVGKSGVVHNYGLHRLHRDDLHRLEETVLELRARERMADDFVNRPDNCHLPAFMIREMELEQMLKQTVIR